jgi:uncharacterized protein (DUF2235 family)
MSKKKLIVFCDGTWNRSDQKTAAGRPCPTNVLKLFEATAAHDKNNNPQIVHYIEGVGVRKWERIRGGGFGYGISDNIKSAYSFIVSNYEPGDEIFLFGFSRGAYTARSIAGMIRNVGILQRDKLHLVTKAYEIYEDRAEKWHPNSDGSIKFREENTYQNETIKFLGVWDTVGALGVPFGAVMRGIIGIFFKYRFHDVQLSSIIDSAYHALAIDERRWPFRPSLWELNAGHQQKNAGDIANGRLPSYEQKWFPGVHSNVGGGYADTGLSDCALGWMVEKASFHGLQVDLKRLSTPPYAPNVMEKIENSQNSFYRKATLLFVKKVGSLSIKLIFPKEDRKYVQYIDDKGDYIRPIENRNDISARAREKIKGDGTYRPSNIPPNNA